MKTRQTAKSILVLTTTLPTEEGDSTPSFVLDLAVAMAEQMPAEITIVAPAAPGAPLRQTFGAVTVHRFRYLPARLASLGASTAIVPALRERPVRVLQVPFLLVGLLVSALVLARRLRPDIVHSHWVVPVGLIGHAVARAVGAVHAVTSHGSDVNALRGRLWDRLRRRVTDTADLVLPVSEELAHKLGLPTQTVIPMGVSPMFTSDRRTETELGHALFVGRLADNKGVDILLQATARTPEAQVMIVGDGPERTRLERLSEKLDLAGRVTFKGALGTGDIAELMRTSRVLVAPSTVTKDGSGAGTTVLLEAVTAGLPIIVSRTGAASDLFENGNTARIVEPGDVGQLASALKEAYRSPDIYSGFAASAYSRVGQQASMRHVARQYCLKLQQSASIGAVTRPLQ